MRRTLLVAAAAVICAGPLAAQEAAPERAPTARPVLGWRLGIAAYTFRNFTLFEAIDRARAAGLRNIEGFDGQKVSLEIPKPLNPGLTEDERAALREKLRSSGVAMPTWYHHKFAATDESCRRVFEFARSLGIETIVGEPDPDGLPLIDKYAQEYGVNMSLHNHGRETSPVYWDPRNTMRVLEGRSRRIGVTVDLGFWFREGLNAAESLRLVQDRLMTLHLKDVQGAGATGRDVPLGAGAARLEETLREVFRLGLKPVVTIEYSASPADPTAGVMQSAAFTGNLLQRLVAERVETMSRTTAMRRKLSPTHEEKVAAAIPAKAPARPLKPRKLLVIDMQVAYGGHRSIPHANLAIELMGKKTGAFVPTFSNDLANLRWENLRQYDGLYLNNTVGPLFNSPEIRESLLRFVREGGGLAGNHGTTHASLDWPDFAAMIGGRNGPHRDANEKVTVKLDDPASPINAPFKGEPFTFVDEYFRFPTAPYSRSKLHILISFDVPKTDMNQGRACDACVRADNDYAISWIREYGKGRVFYCSLGHNPDVFFTPTLVEHFLAGIQYALGDLKADATPSTRLARSLADMEPVLARVATFEDGQDRQALVEFADFVSDSLGSPERLSLIEKRLLVLLRSPATRAAKDFAFRQLSLIGTATSVPVLAGMLSNGTAGMARYALARIPGAAATAALRRGMARSSGAAKIALVNSLGERRDALSVPALRSLLSSPDAKLAEAAAAALARIGNQPALAALASVRTKASLGLRPRLTEAYLHCAEQMAADGGQDSAIKVYRQLAGAGEPETIRIRALGGLAAALGKDAEPALTADLPSQPPKIQAAAVRLLNDLPGPEITAVLVDAFPKLPPTAQVRVLAALADRRDTRARPLFTEAAESPSAQVRAAALAGLGKIGDAASLPLLAGAAANREGAEQAAARASLYRMPGRDVDAAVVSAIGSTSGKIQFEYIAAAGERGVAAAGDALVAAAQSGDREIRRQALRALRTAGGPAQVPAVLDLLTGAADSTDRREAARTLAMVLRNPEPAHARAVVEACERAPSTGARTALLEVMGQASSDEMLPVLRKSVQDPDPEVSRAAILALSAWNTSAPLPDLLAIAKSAANPTQQVLALRGFIRLVSVPAGRSDAESVRLLAEAMQLATRPDDKKAVLSVLPAFNCRESLELAKSSLGDPALAREARIAVERLNATLNAR